MNKKDAYTILRVLLPWLDVMKEFRLGCFTMMKNCTKGLGGEKGGTSWDEEIRTWEREVWKW